MAWTRNVSYLNLKYQKSVTISCDWSIVALVTDSAWCERRIKELYSIYVAKIKMLYSCEVTAQVICIFVFAYAKNRFTHDLAHFAIRSGVILIAGALLILLVPFLLAFVFICCIFFIKLRRKNFVTIQIRETVCYWFYVVVARKKLI